ncbi:MAG: DNA-binding protein [Candidatus Eisenbacteria bacterium]|uniref:DNA-binding protein n=1 Tax=Eiseniibacteriota bacterium TaxID=2212470 RepID=A0A948RVU2_UNCEI|nr:DNA-binding protein [Candidatus Eisenbacteria bacterium]MBU1947737.1 DNA-binding protein [Candidatus Eisenbacteria bacterium]MBU2691800.1 DNA-binding protein [Candidatus Eisenbacteria bacterium]
MDYRSKGDVLFIRLHPGEIVPDILGEISRKAEIETAVIVSGVGMLKDVELSYFVGQGRYESHHFTEPLELISLSGNISRQDDGYIVHAHAALAEPDGRLVGGHLTRGSVWVTNEIMLSRIPIKLLRLEDRETGLRGISFPDE